MDHRRFLITALAGIVPIVVFLRLPYGTWADFAQLPMHPLIVHGVIVASRWRRSGSFSPL
ncbi:MAG: hypothetical protein R2755_18690 [Acidimicrobiales bacterium]